MIVIAGITEDQHGGLRANVFAVVVPEDFERVAVVGVTVYPHDIGFAVDPMDGFGDVVGLLEELGHLVESVDEHERSHLGELARQGVDEMQGEPREGGYRTRDIGDHHDLGLLWTRIPELGLRGDAAVRQRGADGVAEIERTFAPASTLARQAHRELPSKRVDGLAKVRHLLAAGVHEIDVFGERLAQGLGHRLHPTIGH